MSSLLTTFLLLAWTNSSFSQLCNNRVTRLLYLASPSTFRGMTALMPSVCNREGQVGSRCSYSVIIGDNEPVPLQPNLENSGGGNNDIGKFLVWPSSTNSPYMTFDLGSAQSVTAITIEFLNYPAQGFSLPNLQLYDTSSFFTTDPNNAQRIEFELRNNSVLSRGDYQATNVSLIFSRSSSSTFLLRWDYTGVYNLNFFMVSEVDFCNDAPPRDETQITFQDPQSNNSVIIPTVEELTGTRNTTINCTVSSSGLFEWRWRQNGSVISNNGKFIIFIADGTRTSILQIAGLSVSDAAEYTCEVSRRGDGEYMPRTQILSFPVFMDLPGQLVGYLDEGEVELTCKVHGILKSTDPPTWLNSNGSPIDSSCPLKYTVTHSSLTSQLSILLSNGSKVPSLRSILIIKQLEVGDEGQYTCAVEGNFSVVALLIQTRSTTTLNQATSLNEPSCIQSESSSIQSVVVASFVSSLITATIVIAVSIVIHAGVWFYKKSHSNETCHQARQGNSNEGVYEIVDDKAATAINMTTNEAYATTTIT